MRREFREVTLYEFHELTEKQQQEMIQNTLEYYYDNQDFEDKHSRIKNLKERIKKVEKRTEEMQTPWFFISFMYEEFKDEIMEIVINDEYYEDGSVA